MAEGNQAQGASGQHTPGPWYADWEILVHDARTHLRYRREAAALRSQGKRAQAARTQVFANCAAESLRWCADAIIRDNRAAIAAATQGGAG